MHKIKSEFVKAAQPVVADDTHYPTWVANMDDATLEEMYTSNGPFSNVAELNAWLESSPIG